MYGISQWLLYSHIKSDPSFPVVNVGIKKKYLIDLVQFDLWLKRKSGKDTEDKFNLPSSSELLGGSHA